MQNADANYRELIQRLDTFIRKYYSNQLLRGGIYAFTLLLAFFLTVTLLESFAWFGTGVRTAFFYTYLITTAFVLWKWVLLPLSKLYKLGAVISHEEAAVIIGKHFSDISDKLINTLQLNKQTAEHPDQLQLIHASINQKSAELKPIPFTAAIDFKKSKRLLKYAAIPACVFLVLLFAAPSLITDPAKRLLQHSTAFSKPAPFDFSIDNKKLQVVQFEDFNLELTMTGKEIPLEIYIAYNGNQYRMERQSTVHFSYSFRNVQSDLDFHFLADGYNSNEYSLKVVPNPVVLNFSVQLDYPDYLGKQNESIKNNGDMMVPAGTRISWIFGTKNTSAFQLRLADSIYQLKKSEEEDQYLFQYRILHSTNYSIHTANEFMVSKDSMQYNIVVIPDQYPAIQVEQQQDSSSYQRMYFRGLAKDDYGLNKLQFHYRFLKRGDKAVNEKAQDVNIAINRNAVQEQFFHFWDMSAIGLQPGDELEYYFEIWDNDGVQGPKSSRSQTAVFAAPSLSELANDAEQKNKALKDDLSESLKKARELQKEMAKLQRDLNNKKTLEYEDRKRIADLLKEQKELEQKLNEIQQNNEKNNKQESEFRKTDPELAAKQKNLEEMMEKLMSPEMKKMMEELEKMMAEVDKQKIQEAMDKMKLDNKDLEKQLDRTLELYKQLELQKKVEETAKRMDELGKKQEELAAKGEEKNADADKLEAEQKELNKEFDELKKELDDIQKKNEELDFAQDLKNTDQEEEEIKQDMQESSQQLGQNQPKKAAKKQKSAAEKMQKMAQEMSAQMQQAQQEQEEEDMNSMRALLENLLRFSFDQEKLMEDLKGVDVNNPRYLTMAQTQRKLKDDAKVLEDSLLALSKRVMKISSMVNEQLTDINANTEKALANLQDRQVPTARANQQFVMTAVNNLALMLSESLDQQQQQMQQQSGSSSCKKPGQGKPKPGPSAGDIKKMQEKLSEQLKQMKEKMDKEGKNPNGKKPGGQGGQGGMSEELARMAAQQEALRNALQQLNQNENKDGQGKLGDLGKIAQQMEETEKDIVNRRLTEMTLKRQQDILTRLLESEKAEREREKDEKRESQQATQIPRNPPQFEEYKRMKMRETELLKTIPPSFTTFYKNLVNSYFQSIED